MALIALLLSATPRLARAQETLDNTPIEERPAAEEPEEISLEAADHVDFDDRPFAVGAMMGFGTPVGLIGVVGMYTPDTAVSLGAGAGVNAFGPQLAAMATLRSFSWARQNAAHAISFTPAWSTGPWKGMVFDTGLSHDGPEDRAQYRHWASDRAHWLQADLSYEVVKRTGFWLRAGWGFAWMLNPGDARCELVQTEEPAATCEGIFSKGFEPDEPIITLTVVLGYALDRAIRRRRFRS